MSLSLARRHPWWAAVAALLVLVLALVAARWATSGDEVEGEGVRGPEGAAFYEPSSEQVEAGEHGSVIWSRRVVSGPTIGGRTHLVLYRSTGAKGETVPVSGVVTVPEGDAPEGGWPVVSWGHGTTGMADDCAPSRSRVDPTTGVYTSVMDETTTDLVDRGYAVVRTDYEGLGTPGPHPYLMGRSAGASMADIVLAARELEPDLSSRWLAMGHSQGAHAALFTSEYTGAYTPGLDLLGIVALAPPSQLGAVVGMLDSPADADAEGPTVEDSASSSVFLGPLVVSGARVAGVPVEEVVSEEGREHLPDLERRCIAELQGKDSLGGIAPRDFLEPEADLSPVEGVVESNDPSVLTPEVPVVLVQGGQDEAVPAMLTDRLAEQYGSRDVDVDHVRKPRASHLSVLEEGAPEMRTWVEEAFGG